jgi:thiamine biosynthesis lipoprotein
MTIFFNAANVRIDLGGIAKGYAVDNGIQILKEQGVTNALVTAGGDTRLLGDRRGRDWVVGIRDPRDKAKQAVLLPLSNTAMSTSGDYERYFEDNGKRYHHILSPKTGKSATGVQSVSIISNSSTANDALSTAVFVLGVNAGLDLINQLEGVDAIIMDEHRKLHYSHALYQE